jgi:hypothetical protein
MRPGCGSDLVLFVREARRLPRCRTFLGTLTNVIDKAREPRTLRQ